MKFMVFVLLIAVLGLSSIVGFNFSQIASSRAQARAQNLQTWHKVLCVIEAGTIADKTVPRKRKLKSVHFLDNLLIQIRAQPCGLKVH